MFLRKWVAVPCVFVLEAILAGHTAQAQDIDPQPSLPPVTVTPARAAPSRPLRPRPAPKPVLRAAPAAGRSAAAGAALSAGLPALPVEVTRNDLSPSVAALPAASTSIDS